MSSASRGESWLWRPSFTHKHRARHGKRHSVERDAQAIARAQLLGPPGTEFHLEPGVPARIPFREGGRPSKIGSSPT